MDESAEARGTGTALVLVSEAAPRPSLARLAPVSAFLSQLIAERQKLAPQRRLRRAGPLEAADAYRTGARIDERRLPAGYRRSVVA